MVLSAIDFEREIMKKKPREGGIRHVRRRSSIVQSAPVPAQPITDICVICRVSDSEVQQIAIPPLPQSLIVFMISVSARMRARHFT